MSSHLNPQHITSKEIMNLLDRYDAHVPDSLKSLDKERYENIPRALKERTAQGHTYLTKTEVESLVQWKM